MTQRPHDPKAMSSRFRRGLSVSLLLVFASIAVLLWTAPLRHERILRSASLTQLQALSNSKPEDARASYYLGRRLQQLGQPAQAYEALARACEMEPSEEDYWLSFASVASELYGDQGAFDLLSAFLKARPDSHRAHYALALLYQRRGTHRRAFEEVQTAVELNPKNADYQRLLGREALAWKQPTKAEEALRKAVELAPNDWRNHQAWGDFLMVGQKQAALEAYRKAAELAPKEPAPVLAQGRLRLEGAKEDMDSLEAAKKHFVRAFALQPDNPQAHLGMGRVLARQGKWQEAKAALLAAQRLAPEQPAIAFELIGVYRKLGEREKAEQSVKRHAGLEAFQENRQIVLDAIAREIKEGHSALAQRRKLARLCLANGDWGEAAYQYERVLMEAGDDQEAKARLAQIPALPSRTRTASEPLPDGAAGTLTPSDILKEAETMCAAQKTTEARAAYAAVLKREPGNALALQGMGLLLNAKGQDSEAFRYLLEAARRDPKLAEAQFTLGEMYHAAEFGSEAVKRMKAALAVEPNNARYWNGLGRAAGVSELTYGEAEAAFQKAVELSPQILRYLLDLAESLANNHKPDKAEAVYRQGLALAPEDGELLSRMGGFLLDNKPSAAKKQEAETLLQKALKIDPHDDFARYQMGKLALERGDAKTCVTLLSGIVARTSTIADVWYTLSRAYQRLGEPKKAALAMENSRQLREGYIEVTRLEETIRYHLKDASLRIKLARLNVLRGENAKAINQYMLSLKADPDNRAAREELNALVTRLKAADRLPSMNTFNAMIASFEHPQMPQ